MIYEFIATMAAGFGLAGIALIITHLSKLVGKPLPKWIIPLAAAIGIFSFQVHQEYNWYDQQVAKLPDSVKVIRKIEDSAWFRPWSYVIPQTVRFMAVDSGTAQVNADNENVHLVNLYLFGRRLSVKQIPQVIDCAAPARADYVISKEHSALPIKEYVQQTTKWRDLPTDDPLYIAVCLDKS